MIPLATTTLNLLLPSRINPKLSDKALLDEAFGYNKTPLAPLGTKVLLQETPKKIGTWAPHGVGGWYVVAAPDHSRFHRIFVLQTHKERIARTMEFFLHKFSMSTTLSAYSAIVAAQDLVHALQHPESATSFTTVQSNQAAVLATLSEEKKLSLTVRSSPTSRITSEGAHITISPHHTSKGDGYITQSPIARPGSRCLSTAIHHQPQ